MANPESTDLTYGEFVKLRAAALARLHGLQSLRERITVANLSPITPETAKVYNDAVIVAEANLAQVLDRWARSKFNRQE